MVVRGVISSEKTVVPFQSKLQSLNQPCLTSRLLAKAVKLRQLLVPVHHSEAPKSMFREEIMLLHILDEHQLFLDGGIQSEQVEHLAYPSPTDTKALRYLTL